MVSHVAAPAMTSVRVVEPRSVTWKYRSRPPEPLVLGLGGDQIAIGAPFTTVRSDPAPGAPDHQRGRHLKDTDGWGPTQGAGRGIRAGQRALYRLRETTAPWLTRQVGQDLGHELLEASPPLGGPAHHEVGEAHPGQRIGTFPHLVPRLRDRQVAGAGDRRRIPSSLPGRPVQDRALPLERLHRPEPVPDVAVAGSDGNRATFAAATDPDRRGGVVGRGGGGGGGLPDSDPPLRC